METVFDLDDRRFRVQEKEKISTQQGFWDDSKKAEAILKEMKKDSYWVKLYENTQSIYDDLEVMQEFYEMEEISEEELEATYQTTVTSVEDLEFKSTLNKEEDSLFDCST